MLISIAAARQNWWEIMQETVGPGLLALCLMTVGALGQSTPASMTKITVQLQRPDSSACSRLLEKISEEPKHVQQAGPPTRATSPTIVVPASDPWHIASLTEPEKMGAIQCLLTAESDLLPAAFSGATRLDTSEVFAPIGANLAALYAISYIYSGRYDHAAAVALRGDDASYIDSNGSYVTKPSAIHKAYQAYRVWFQKVRQVGLAKAQQSGLDPLDGTGLHWY